MKIYKTILSSLFLLGITLTANAQNLENLTDMNGTVWRINTYAEIKGSPFLLEGWAKGNVKFTNNSVLKNVALKYDQVMGDLLFKGKNDESYYFNDPVREFSLTYIDNNLEINQKFRNGFPNVKNLTEKSFYEVLVDGKVKLLKRNNKSISETKEFNSATVVKEVNQNIVYYIARGTEIIPLKKSLDLKSLAAAIDPQKPATVIDFSNQNKFDPRTEADLEKIVTYYNSLTAQ